MTPIEQQIEKVVDAILCDYQQQRDIDRLELRRKPDKDAIIDIIEKLRRIVFPGYFREKNYRVYNAKHNLSLLIEDVMFNLTRQIALVYQENGEEARQELQVLDGLLETYREGLDVPGLITFHDGFRYFCHAYDLPLLESIEEEAGSEASAKEIVEITHLVKELDIPVIFTEVNGSDATARAIVRETGCAIAQLSMVMDGPDDDLGNYVRAMLKNMLSITDGFAGEEVVTIQ